MRCSFPWVGLQRLFLHALPNLNADYIISKPDILTQIERGEEPCPSGPWGQEKGSEEETECLRKPDIGKYWYIPRLLGQNAFLGRLYHFEAGKGREGFSLELEGFCLCVGGISTKGRDGCEVRGGKQRSRI